MASGGNSYKPCVPDKDNGEERKMHLPGLHSKQMEVDLDSKLVNSAAILVSW